MLLPVLTAGGANWCRIQGCFAGEAHDAALVTPRMRASLSSDACIASPTSAPCGDEGLLHCILRSRKVATSSSDNTQHLRSKLAQQVQDVIDRTIRDHASGGPLRT